MRRRLFTILSGLSLLLFVAVAVLWVRSHSVVDVVHWVGHPDEWKEYEGARYPLAANAAWTYATRGDGVIVWYRASENVGDPPTDREGWYSYRETPMDARRTPWVSPGWRIDPHLFTDFGRDDSEVKWDWREVSYRQARYLHAGDVATIHASMLVFPLWMLAGSLAVLPAAWMTGAIVRRSTSRMRIGLCPSCGYDLRATPERCPECGSQAAQPVG